MKKSLTLAMALALGVTASAYAANPFSDVPAGHWAYDSVAKLAAAGVVEGYAEGTFDGEKLMTRYEMAQIVAKAMAKGARVDKLAAEFADELDTLGVRVAKLESKADAVKITGEIRYHYADMDLGSYTQFNSNEDPKKIPGSKFHESQLRSRIWITGQVNDDWSYTGMIQNVQDFADDDGEEDTDFQRAYVQGKLGGLDVTAGRYNVFLVNGNLYDTRADGIEASYGKDVKLTAFYMKPTDQNGVYGSWSKPDDSDKPDIMTNYAATIEWDKAWGVKVDTQIGAVKATAGYTVFKDGEKSEIDLDADEVSDTWGLDDNKIWNVGVAFDLAKDLSLTADYLKSDFDKWKADGDEDVIDFKDDDGFILGLNYKGAKATEPGTYGVYANYYDQARGTVIAHTMNGYHGTQGFEGYMIGANYTLAKNIVAALEWYDLESKGSVSDTKAGQQGEVRRTFSKQDMETLWAQVVFLF